MNTSLPINQAIEKFEDYLKGQKHPLLTVSTYIKNVCYFRDWLKDNSITTKTAEQIFKEDVTEYLIHLAKNGSGRPYTFSNSSNTGLGATTLKKKLAAIRKFSLFLLESGYHKTDFTNGIKSPRIPKREPAFLNQQEYKLLLYEAQQRGKIRDFAILMVLLQCGLRESELIKLTLEDLDLEKRELHLRNRKGGVDTDIPLPSPAIEALKKWLAIRNLINENIDHRRIFVSKTNKPLDERAIRYLVKYYMKKAGIKKQASTHTLRHTFGAFKSAKNVDLKTLQYWMGHKSPETTLHYLHLVKKRAPELMEATTL
ncbi:MAG: tyrosine-type recombinase/integrase [Actinobacteria bacterium]|nr:tyrosine-type recombinase/integrase [Actinomycetota bacterium]